MEKMDPIVAEMRRQLETTEEGIEELRSGGDMVREEMQMVSDSTVDIVHKNIEKEARGELQRSTQWRTFKEIVANRRDKKEKLPWKWECYFCEGEHKSTECPQYLILLARIQKRENEEECEDSYSDTDSEEDEEEEEEEEIGPTQVSTEDRGSEPHLDITEMKEDGPTTERVVPNEIEVEGGLVTEEFFPNEIQLILVEGQNSLSDELPPKEVEPKIEPTSVIRALNKGSYQMPSLELEELQKQRKDRCRKLSSRAPILIHEGRHHPRLKDFVKEKSLPKNANNMEHVKSRLEVKNFHEEKT